MGVYIRDNLLHDFWVVNGGKLRIALLFNVIQINFFIYWDVNLL